MQLFFNSEITKNSTFFTFDKNESKHIIKVLRKNEGDTIFITNGKGTLFTSKITTASDRKCEVKIVTYTTQKTSNYQLHIAIAPTKNNNRFEWFLEKATEIGIHEITPIICSHSERKVYKTERANKIVQSAMKQSVHYFLPKVNEPISFSNFITKEFENTQKFIAHCEETERFSLKNVALPNKNTIVLIGPEGDFSTEEITQATTNNYKAVILGKSRLRTETAGIVTCSTLALINE